MSEDSKHPTSAADIDISPAMAAEISEFPYTVSDFVHIAPVPPSTEIRRGIVGYIGPTMFADGIWVGIELVGSKGKNDGSVLNVKYFDTKAGQGAFVRPELVTPFGEDVGSVMASIAASVKGLPVAASEKPVQGEPPTSWPVKSLSGKTELELLGDVEKLKDEKHELETLVNEAKEKIEGLELDLELAKEEKLLAEDEIEELKLRVSIAESGGKGVCDDEEINIMMAIKKSAAEIKAENEKLHRQLEDMKEQISSIDNNSNIIDSITEQNLELTDEVAALNAAVANLKKENEDLKQLQFILDEEMSLQQAQTDEYAAEVERLKELLYENSTSSSSTANGMKDKYKNLQEEISHLQAKIKQDKFQAETEIKSRDRQLYCSSLALDHMLYLTRQQDENKKKEIDDSDKALSSSSLLLINVDQDELNMIVTDMCNDFKGNDKNTTVDHNHVEHVDECKFRLKSVLTESKNIVYNLTEVFNSIVDEQHVLSNISNKAQQCIDIFSQGMKSLENVVSNITQAKCLRAVNTAAIETSPSSAMFSSEDLMSFDIATSLLIAYVMMRQLSSIFLDPIHHDILLRYCRENRNAMLRSVSTSSCDPLIPGILQNIIDDVTFLVKGATIHAIPGAESSLMSVSHIRARGDSLASTMGNLFRVTISGLFQGDEVSCINAIHNSCDRFWSNPANDIPNFASASLLRALLEATRKGYDQVMRVLKSPQMASPVFGNMFLNDEKTIDDCEGSINDTIMGYFDDSEKLLYKTEISLKEALGGYQQGADTAGLDVVDDISGTAVLIKVAGVEAAAALLLLLHSTVVFSSILGIAERDVQAGFFSTLPVAIASHLSNSGRTYNASGEVPSHAEVKKRLWMFTDSVGSLYEIIKTNTDGKDQTGVGESSSDVSSYWRIGVSPTFALIRSTNSRDTVYSTMTQGSSKIPVQKLVFLSPFLKTLAVIDTDSKRDERGTDDLDHSSISTIVSLFIHGSVRKDITREVPATSLVSLGAARLEGKGTLTPMAAYCRRSLLRTLAVDKFNELFSTKEFAEGDHNSGESGPRQDASHGAVAEALAQKDSYIASLKENIQEMEMRLWEAKSEKNVIELFQQELETVKRQLDASEKSHQSEMAKQEREFEEAYRKTTAAKALVDRELRMLKTEEKLSPLSAQERHQHNLQIKYYTKLLSQLSFGGLPALGPIGTSNLISLTGLTSSSTAKAPQQSIIKEELKQRLRRRKEEIYFSGLAAVAACHQEAITATGGISSSCFSKRSVPFSEVCTNDATRLLMTLHHPSLHRRKCHESLHKQGHVDGETDEKIMYEDHDEKEAYKVPMPKILSFGSAEECKRSRLGLLVF